MKEVNAAYERLSLYEKHCPMVLYEQKIIVNRKPWITKGLENDRKKKNKLYRDLKTGWATTGWR